VEKIAASVEKHYGVGGVFESILEALHALGKDLNQLTPPDLAPVDAFHIRGREATAELAQVAELSPNLRVVDVGCGLGGATRYLASEHGCRTTGIDLTREYCEIAAALSARVGLSEVVDFRHCSALHMPFDDATFDIAWTEHTQMNIRDKTAFYTEIARVLRPGGRLVFHDIFQGEGGEVFYPVPWAEDSSISFLVTPAVLRQILAQVGLREIVWEDKTIISLDWFRRAIKRMQTTKPSPLGLHLLTGENSKTKFGNIIRNLEAGRIVVLQAVLERIG
jgi:ubiquinone/menaquinone biosynthesis C-methylase UbiE